MTIIAKQGLFIAGTDTDVGKTYVGTRLIRLLRAQGVAVTARKPVESGCPNVSDTLRPQDALQYYAALEEKTDLATLCPYRFAAALAPPIAAALAQQTLLLEQLITACRPAADTLMLVEGAGGVYSPLASDALNVDLAVALHLPVLLVAGNRLGTINQTLLACEALARHDLALSAVVLNQTTPNEDTRMLQTNRSWLMTHLDCPVYALPYQEEAVAMAQLQQFCNASLFD